MKRTIALSVLTLGLGVAPSAWAEWQWSASAAARYARATETDINDRRIVREQGWLPGLGVSAQYAVHDWRWRMTGEIYRNDLDYSGSLQSGARFSSETGTTQWRINLEAAKQLTDATRVLAGIERDVWRRDIAGTGNIAGLQERFASWRIVAGAEARLGQWNAGAVDMKGLLVFARPERVHVHFGQQLFDDAELDTKPAVGLRLGVGFLPTATPKLALEAELEWMETRRSNNATLRRNGAAAGFLAQPRHERVGLGLRASYWF